MGLRDTGRSLNNPFFTPRLAAGPANYGGRVTHARILDL